MRFRTQACPLVLTVLVAILLGIGLLLPSNTAWGDAQSDLADAEAAADEAKAAYEVAVADYEQAASEFDEVQGQIEAQEQVLATDREQAWTSAKVLYTHSGDKLSLFLEILLSGNNLSEIIAQMDGAAKLFGYHEGNIIQVRDDLAVLEQRRVEVQAAVEEKDAKKAELEAAMDEALAAYDEAQAAAVAAQQKASDGSSTSLGDYGSDKVSEGATLSVSQLKFMGVVYANGWRYTYYEESVLPGPGLAIPARHHEDGKVCDGDGYICVASSDLPKGTVVPTPLGPGKVYDSGCASGTLDLYLA